MNEFGQEEIMNEFEKWWRVDCPSPWIVLISKADAAYIFRAGAAAAIAKLGHCEDSMAKKFGAQSHNAQ